jgi:hypothetical protein
MPIRSRPRSLMVWSRSPKKEIAAMTLALTPVGPT